MSEGAQGLYVIAGVMASGKSTVAELLARRFEKGVHVRGDGSRRMVVSGREEMTPEPSGEALRQYRLRCRLAAAAADAWRREGFSVAVQDNWIGRALPEFLEMVQTRPLYLTVLCPRPDVVAAREAARPKRGYGAWTPEAMDALFRAETPRIGLWLDSSILSPEETVDEILRRAPREGRIG